jgi:cobalt-precorrin 5A hydrolase
MSVESAVKQQPKIAMVAITLHGTAILKKLAGKYEQADIFLSEKFIALGDDFPESNKPKAIDAPIRTVMGQLFEHYDLLVFVFSIGAAVRLMAPYLKSKREDPGVVVIDDCANFIIPVLSGHIGGANAFAGDIADALGSTVVYTTASESRQTLPVDILGRELGWVVEAPHSNQVKVAAHVVNDEAIAFIQEAGSKNWWPEDKKLPANIHLFDSMAAVDLEQFRAVLWVTHRDINESLWQSLEGRLIVYRPPIEKIVLGVGCDRDTPLESIEQVIFQALDKANLKPEQVQCMASIDKKSDEVGLLALAEKYQWSIDFYTAEQLSEVTVPNPSEVVRKYVGTPAVAEAAALLSAKTQMHDLIIEKHKYRGADNRNATVSIARYKETAVD